MDVVRGIGESVRGEWWGDVDLNDGSLDLLYQDYQKQLSNAARVGLGDDRAGDVRAAAECVEDHLTLLHSGELLVIFILPLVKVMFCRTCENQQSL